MEQAPAELGFNTKSYLDRQFIRIQNDIKSAIELDVLTAIPLKPRKGKLYYFGNAIGAITSEGYWGYTSAGWVKLG